MSRLFPLVLATACATTPAVSGAPVALPAAEGSRSHFHLTLETRAPPEAIWALWTDVASWPRWDTEVQQVALEATIALDVQGTLTPKAGSASRFRISAWEPARRYAFTTALPGGQLTVTRSLEVVGGVTRFTHDVAFTGAMGWLFAGILGGRFREALPGVMDRLRVLAEGGGA